MASLRQESHGECKQYFNPNAFLTGAVVEISQLQQPHSIAHSLHGEILIDPVRRRYLSAGDLALENFSTSAYRNLLIRPLERWQSDAGSRPLEELLWLSAWHACDGRLPSGSSRYDVIALRHWPNLTRLPCSANTLRLCALLSRKPHSLHLARKLLDISEQEAFRFYSAAWSAGLLDRLSHQEEAATTSPEIDARPVSLTSTLMHLWHRLAG